MFRKKQNKESIEEFIARGGKVEQIPYSSPEEEAVLIKPSPAGPPAFYSLDEAQHFFAEVKPRRRKPKQAKPVDIDKSLLPKHLQSILEELDE